MTAVSFGSRARMSAGILCAAGLAVWLADSATADTFRAGAFSFSDELGGFRIVSVSGSGTKSDPAIVEEELFEVAPIVLVIRRVSGQENPWSIGQSLSLTKIVRNESRRIWAGFEMELQEIRDLPSVYGDGLSFNQMDIRQPDVSSDSFNENDRLFEPHDRIRFQTGHVDPSASARFSVVITDPTPVEKFYLVQDPQILFAQRRMPAASPASN